MADKLSIHVEGVPIFLSKLRGLERQMEDFSNVFEAAGGAFYRAAQENFDTEGRGEWEGLSDGYRKRKEAIYGDMPILQASRALYDSLTEKDAPHNIHRISADTCEFGTDLEYLEYHRKRKGRLPTRDPLDFSDEQIEGIAEAVFEQLFDEVEALGFDVRR